MPAPTTRPLFVRISHTPSQRICSKYPDLKYTAQTAYTYYADNFESHDVGSDIVNASPDFGGKWRLSTADTGGFFIEHQLSFGDGYQCLAATSGGNVALYSGDAKLRLDPNYPVTADFDVYLPSGCQATVSLQKSQSGPPVAAVSANSLWQYWNGTSYVTTGVSVSYDIWNHVQIALDCKAKTYKLVVQPCGSLPTLLGTYSWDSGTKPGDQVFFAISPQGVSGQIGYFDNIVVTGPPPCISGDMNGDCRVDLLDFSMLAGRWLQNVLAGDLNTDGAINTKDLLIFAGHWLQSDP